MSLNQRSSISESAVRIHFGTGAAIVIVGGSRRAMAIVVIGGQSREVGKTSVVAGLISALPHYNWTAFKLTQFGHGRCSLSGEPCTCATYDRCWAINEEKDASGTSDTSRFLAAGAKRSFWVRTEQGRLGDAVPQMQRRIAACENAIFESNSIIDFIQPDIYISVLDPSVEDFKASAQRLLRRVDAVIVHHAGSAAMQYIELAQALLPARMFYISPPEYVSAEIVVFVSGQIEKCHVAQPR